MTGAWKNKSAKKKGQRDSDLRRDCNKLLRLACDHENNVPVLLPSIFTAAGKNVFCNLFFSDAEKSIQKLFSFFFLVLHRLIRYFCHLFDWFYISAMNLSFLTSNWCFFLFHRSLFYRYPLILPIYILPNCVFLSFLIFKHSRGLDQVSYLVQSIAYSFFLLNPVHASYLNYYSLHTMGKLQSFELNICCGIDITNCCLFISFQ